ncbi:MAG TPA: cytochrome c, partial [Vicinamibacterales bacterium]
MNVLRVATVFAFAAALSISITARQAPGAEPVYTQAEATAGQASYQANCASCHMPDLAGQNEAPPLRGANFIRTWRERSTRDLVEYMQATMPPGKPSLSTQEYLNITAFILRSNGAASGTQPLRPSATVTIGSIATGAPAAERPAAAAGGTPVSPRPAVTPPSRGHSVTGEVKNYVPVTDAMLRNPPPGD